MKIKLIALLLLAIVSGGSAQAKKYYVATDGNDNNIGSEKEPFRTLAKASAIAQAGDQCIIKQGTYYEVLNPRNSGTKSQPIIFKNYKDDRVVIDATQNLEEWSQFSGDIYVCSVEMPNATAIYNTLFFDDKLMDIARWPNNSDGNSFSFDGHRIDGGSASHFEVKGLPAVDFSDGYFCYLGAHSGTSWSRPIDSYSDGVIEFEEVDIAKWPFSNHNPTLVRNNNIGQLYLYGKLELLDCPGEWYYDQKEQKLYAMFPEGKAPSSGKVSMGVRKTTMEIDTHHITIEGINCIGGEVRIKGDHCSVSKGEFLNCSQSLEGLIGIRAQSSNSTFVLRGSNITIEDTLIEGGMANGIFISVDGNGENYKIHNNVIRYFNTIGIHASPIRSRGAYATITNNTIYTCGRDGIYSAGYGTDLAYNDVSDCMRINNDGGIFYTVGNEDQRNTVIHHNWFHDSYGPAYADGRVAGIYLDNDSKGFVVHHNIVSNITWSALMINWYNTDINFYNNTIWKAGSSMGRWANGRTMDRITVVNNYASSYARQDRNEGAEWIGTDFEANIIDAESQFNDAQNNDFTLAPNSILRGAGAVIEGYTPKKKVDVGAYKYGEKAWNIGASWASEVL